MTVGDPSRIGEIKALKRKPNEEEARKILDKIAKQVQPIMRKHNWTVKALSEFMPKARNLLGLNYGRGLHIKLRLRMSATNDSFLPYHQVLDTMLHELCHNVHSPHNASFYKLWDEIRKECEDLMNNGISGTGQGFDLPGKRLGGASKPLHSSLRQVALTAAETRARLQSLLPSGAKKIGGDSSIMAALSPGQAAAMAAERRLQDNIWCGSEFCDLTGDDECDDSLPESLNKGCCSGTSRNAFNEHDLKGKSQKRRRGSDDVSSVQYADKEQKPILVDLTNEVQSRKDYRKDLYREASTSSSLSSHDLVHESSSVTWQCTTCTLLNPPLAPICGLCTSEKPKKAKMKSSSWSCRFCTLENDVKLDKCDVCGSWRYSYGPPGATSAPNLGT